MDPARDESLIFELLDYKHEVGDDGSAVWFLQDLAIEQDGEGFTVFFMLFLLWHCIEIIVVVLELKWKSKLKQLCIWIRFLKVLPSKVGFMFILILQLLMAYPLRTLNWRSFNLILWKLECVGLWHYHVANILKLQCGIRSKLVFCLVSIYSPMAPTLLS